MKNRGRWLSKFINRMWNRFSMKHGIWLEKKRRDFSSHLVFPSRMEDLIEEVSLQIEDRIKNQ